MVEPFILRRLKTSVSKDLPEKIEEVYYVEQTEKERKLYLANLQQINNELISNAEVSDNKIKILAMLTKLRQICIDPRLLYENISEISSKIKVVVELIQKSIQNREKIIIFSNFTTVLDLLS